MTVLLPLHGNQGTRGIESKAGTAPPSLGDRLTCTLIFPPFLNILHPFIYVCDSVVLHLFVQDGSTHQRSWQQLRQNTFYRNVSVDPVGGTPGPQMPGKEDP